MAEEVIGLRLQLEAAQAASTVGEMKGALEAAKQEAKAIGQAFGENSKEFKQAEKDLSKIVQQFSKFGDTRKDLKEAEKIARGMADAYGATSKEALAAAAAVAQIRDQIKDAKEVSDLFDPGAKFAVFGNVVKTTAAGFAGLQGAMGLFGAESENVQKTLLKVQSAMALSEGLSHVVDAGKDFQRLGAIIKTQVVGAFTTLKGAIIATGVGALVVGVGLLIANFDKVKAYIMNLFPGLGKLTDFIGGLIDKFTDFIGITTEAGRALSKLNDQLEKSLAGQEQWMDLNADKFDEFTQRKMKATIEYNKNQLKFNKQLEDGEITAAQHSALLHQAAQKRLREDTKATEDRVKSVKEAGEKEAAAAKQKSDKIAGINKAAADKRAAELKAAHDREMQAIEELFKLRNENYLATITDEVEQQKARIKIQSEGEIARINNLKVSGETKAALLVELRKKEANALKAIDDQIKKEEQAKAQEEWAAKMAKEDELMLREVEETNKRMAKKAEVLASINEGGMTSEELELFKLEESYKKKFAIIAGNELAEIALKEQFEDAKNRIKQKYVDQELDIVANGLTAVSNLIGAQTVAGKALAISAAIINTYKAASNALANTPGPPPFPQIAMVSAIAMGLKNVKEILKVNVPGGGGAGGASVPSVPAPIVPQLSSTNINQGQINQIANATARAFVVESDMTNNQERITRLNRAARLG